MRKLTEMRGVQNLWQLLYTTGLEGWVQMLVGAWCMLASVLLVIHRGGFETAAFAQDTSWVVLILAVAVQVPVLLLIDLLAPRRVEGYYMVASVGILAFLLTIWAPTDSRYALYYALVLVLLAVLFYAAHRGFLDIPLPHFGKTFGKVTSGVLVGVLFCVMAGAIGWMGWLRYHMFSCPNFDLGIFSQMYHYMKETFVPFTTCERDTLMSHFAVHVSPIFYVLLPAYALFPSPLTLLIGQGVVVASGVIPLYLLARRLGLSSKMSVLSTLIYAAYPALSCGTMYDLHENCFLAPLLLWMFYFYESKKTWPLVIATALVLLVKEDAAIYVALFGVWRICSRREWRAGLLTAAAAVCYFGVAVVGMQLFGDGTLAGVRYGALQYGDSGMVGMVKTLIVNPGLFLKVLFGVDGTNVDRLRYFAQLALPLGVGLFTTRRYSRLLLLTPVLLNLLSDWPYQSNINFQYSFGVAAFWLYLFLLNVADARPVNRRAMVSYAAVAAILLYTITFAMPLLDRAKNYDDEKAERYTRTVAVLDTIPPDASVACSTFLLPHLSARDVIYETYYHDEYDTEYVVLDQRPGYADANEVAEYLDAGYVEVTREPDCVLVLKKTE